MSSSIEESSVCSCDSTASSLLRSCSINSDNPCSDSLIHYKDKLYSSASEALEAYIEDFHLSLTSSEGSTGRICLRHSTPKQDRFSKRRAKQKQAWGDFQHLKGLDSPASSSTRQNERDLDSISLATDDLLAIDASQPFVQPTPSKSRPRANEWNRHSLTAPCCPSAGGGRSVSSRETLRLLSSEESSKTCPHTNYPRWFTSQKSDLSVSGISSIPSVSYPVWLKSCHCDPHSAKEGDGQGVDLSCSQGFETLEKRHSAAKASGCLDGRGEESPRPCCQLRSSFSRGTRQPCREAWLEQLTSKAEAALEGSTEDLTHPQDASSPATTDLLGAERPWATTWKPAAPARREVPEPALPFPEADIMQQFLQDCLNHRNQGNPSPGDQHRRPLEDLKLTSFTLQAIQRRLNQIEAAEPSEELCEEAEAGLQLCDTELIPLATAVREALSRLRGRVGTQQEREEDEQGEETPPCS